MVVDFGRRYLEMVVRLRKLAPPLVEDYTGPEELVRLIDAEPPPAASELAQEAHELARLVKERETEADRRAWVSAQLEAVSTAAAWLGGERFSYRELVARCHGAAATLVPEEQFESAHQMLDRALPGHGDVRERYRRWVQTQLVPRSLVGAGIQALADVLGQRSRELFDLPPDEHASFELVVDKPFAGSAHYKGGLRTKIAINEELPISAFRLLELVSHEAYPGHHAEHACKDAELIRGRGRIELAVFVYSNPQALIAEGIACHGLEIMLGVDAEEIAAGCLHPLGIPYDVEIAGAVREAQQLLGDVRPNIAIMLDEQRASPEHVHAYARQWMLDDEKRIERNVKHLEDRLWRPYESCYTEGLMLCRRYTNADGSRFRRLLHEQITTSDLL